MARMSRRDFLKASSGAAVASGLAGCARTAAPTAMTTPADLAPTSGRRVIVIGGGWGGATAAKYVRMEDPSLEVILIEPNTKFVSCPFSNLVLSGVRSIGSLTFGYNALREQHGVRIIHDTATAIEPDARRVRLGRGFLTYDRLIVAPGVDFQTEQIEGLAAAGDSVLHAWKAGPQTVALAQQLKEMPDGGVFVMSIPPAAYRCPPGPYERACQVAWYLKTRKPRAKLLVLDANQNVISKPALFRAAWQAYPNLEYRASSKVVKVDPAAREVTTEFGDKVRYDAVSEVDHVTYESVKAKNVHVIGDSTIGIPIPKSGTAANSMGKIAATAVVHLINGRAAPQMPPINTCYSWVSDSEVMAVVNAYRIDNGKVVQIEQKLTPGQSTLYAQHAMAWAASIWADILA